MRVALLSLLLLAGCIQAPAKPVDPPAQYNVPYNSLPPPPEPGITTPLPQVVIWDRPSVMEDLALYAEGPWCPTTDHFLKVARNLVKERAIAFDVDANFPEYLPPYKNKPFDEATKRTTAAKLRSLK